MLSTTEIYSRTSVSVNSPRLIKLHIQISFWISFSSQFSRLDFHTGGSLFFLVFVKKFLLGERVNALG